MSNQMAVSSEQHSESRFVGMLPLLVKSYVVRCYHCGRWVGRFPQWHGDDGYFQCEDCDSTAIKIREGRPFGPRCKEWSALIAEFEKDIAPLLADPADEEWVLESVVMPRAAEPTN